MAAIACCFYLGRWHALGLIVLVGLGLGDVHLPTTIPYAVCDNANG